MVQRGVIEKVIVPNKQKKSIGSSKCSRLIENHSNNIMNDGVNSAEDFVDATYLGNVIRIRGLQDAC
jgi:hypothetical protein